MSTSSTPFQLSAYPGVNHIHRARKLIQYEIHKTPLIELEHPTAWNLAATQERVFIKCENYQIGGSFKIRGALHAISRLSEQQRSHGLLASVGGNFACSLSCAAERLGLEVTIVLGADAPCSDLQYASTYNPKLVSFSGTHADARILVDQMARDNGKNLIDPINNEDVLAGYATLAVEILEELPDLENFICPIGSGMLLAGCARVLKELRPSCRIIAVEPASTNKFAQSLQAGRRVEVARSKSIAAVLGCPTLAEMAWDVLRNAVDLSVAVDENEIRDVMRLLYQRLDMVVEPAAAVSLAALARPELQKLGGPTVCLLTGGNIDPERFVKSLIPESGGAS